MTVAKSTRSHSTAGSGLHDHGHRHVEQDMLSVEEAYDRIMAGFAPLGAVELPLLDALGRVLAVDVDSPLDLPPVSNSGMDGYAVRREDIRGSSPESPRRLKVVGLAAAGHLYSGRVDTGTAVRIMTGAGIPEGADTVVPFEETDEVQRRESRQPLEEVAVLADLPFGSNVRSAGEDVYRGQLVLEFGTVLRPAEVGVLASLGMEKVPVVRSPVVAVLATGDELVGLDGVPDGGKIYDSNSFSVAAMVLANGGIPKLLGIAGDNLEDLHLKLESALGSDLIITSAGVSKGDYDIVKDVLTQRGDMNFWSVRMRPAKPLAFGHLNNEEGDATPLLGLPGNPVSAMVAFEMFARPAIRVMLGLPRLPRPTVEGVLTGPIYNGDGRRVYARVQVKRRNSTYYASPTGPQGSNILTSMSKANGLAVCPENLPWKMAGDRVRIIMFDWNEEVDL